MLVQGDSLLRHTLSVLEVGDLIEQYSLSNMPKITRTVTVTTVTANVLCQC